MTDGSIRRTRIAIGGASLIAATVLFIIVFSYLAGTFGYPDVLDRPADEVLPALLALGTVGRIVWLVYGLTPLLLVPTSLGVREAARASAPRLSKVAVWLAMLSAAAMMIGLLRWPTVHWSLAQAWTSASPLERESIAQRFASANFALGNVIGEFLGELFLNGFFLVSAIAVSPREAGRRWLLIGGIVASALGWIAMWRNVTAVVAPIASVNNVVLPLWMLTLGIALVWRGRGPRTRPG